MPVSFVSKVSVISFQIQHICFWGSERLERLSSKIWFRVKDIYALGHAPIFTKSPSTRTSWKQHQKLQGKLRLTWHCLRAKRLRKVTRFRLFARSKWCQQGKNLFWSFLRQIDFLASLIEVDCELLHLDDKSLITSGSTRQIGDSFLLIRLRRLICNQGYSQADTIAGCLDVSLVQCPQKFWVLSNACVQHSLNLRPYRSLVIRTDHYDFPVSKRTISIWLISTPCIVDRVLLMCKRVMRWWIGITESRELNECVDDSSWVANDAARSDAASRRGISPLIRTVSVQANARSNREKQSRNKEEWSNR